MTTATDPQFLDTKGVAALLEVSPATVLTYLYKARKGQGSFPEPATYFGQSPVWSPDAITTWKAQRPGQGKGGGRPPKARTEAADA